MTRNEPPRGLKALLRLYPREHSRRYGDEMWDVVAYRWRSDGASGWATARVVIELLGGVPGVWMDRIRRKTMGMGRGWGLDARFVVRSLWRSRGYVATAVVVLACAVAANASVFSYVRGTLLYEPAYPESERIMLVWGSNVAEGQLRDVISGPDFLDLHERVTTLERVAALHPDAAYLMVDGRPVVMDAQEVSVDFFGVLGVEPFMGRLWGEEDRMTGREATVVVTHSFWADHLGGTPDVIGTVLNFEGDPRTIIGVLPEGFEFISPAPLFTPLHDDNLGARPRDNIHFHVVGKLAEGATVAEANREMRAIMDEIEASWPTREGWSFLVEPLHEVSVEAVRPVIVTLAVTVLLVLVVALVNLATLFRIRAFARGPELAVRAALGAGRWRLTRVLAVETVGLATAGALLGLFATPFILARVADFVPALVAIPESAARVPVLAAILDPSVAAVAFGSAVLGSLLLTAPSFRHALRDGSAGTHSRVHPGMRGTRALVAVELAVATTLCVAAGLVVRSTGALLATGVGIEPEGLLTMYVGDVWGDDAEGRTTYFREVVEQVERVPGVRVAGVMGYVDFQAEDDFAGIAFLDRELRRRSDTREEWRRVGPGLFEAAGMRIVEGRGFESADYEGTPRVAIVNEAFARRHYPGGRAVGELLSTGNSQYRELRIVGVVADVRARGPATPAPPFLYAPYQGDPRGTQGLYIRVDGDPMAFAEAVQDAVWSVDPSQPIHHVSPMKQWVGMWIAVPRAARALVTALAGLAWLLSGLGVFGVVAYAVRTRRSEFGIRLALGASPGRLEVDQFRAITPVIVLGVSIGLAVGMLGARAASAVLYGIEPSDPLALVGAALAMFTLALVATILPARRAGRVDPAEVIYTA